jgi:hypothetical protein
MSLLEKNFLTPEDTTSAARTRWSAEGSAMVADVLRRSGGLPVRVRLQVQGESMLPSLWPGDVVEIASCPLDDVRPGEIVLALRDGRLFLHRFVARCTPNGFRLCGDSMPRPDPQFAADALLGRLVLGADALRCPAPKRASDFEDVTVSLERYPDMNRSFSAQCKGALRLGLGMKWFGAKWSRAVGMLLCHCNVARRLALKLHSRRKASAPFRNPEQAADMSSVELGAS